MPLSTRIIFIEGKKMRICYLVFIAPFFLHLQDCTSMHSTSYNLRAKNGAWSDEKAQKEEKKVIW